jgi:RecJ-like exonuclease
MLMQRLIVLMMAICLPLMLIAVAVSEDEPTYDYVGEKKCKICHKKDGVHPSWMETKHAKAWEVLDEAAQKDEKCIGCHTTGVTAKEELLTGVQCEACHGPGSAYKKKSIMEDHEKAMANGLLMPDSTTCQKCHNENVPEEFRPKEKYNFVKMMETGLHDMHVEAEKKEGE